MPKDKKFKMARENATAEFEKIVDAFNFSISTETKERIVKMDLNNIPMQFAQDVVEADAFIGKIMTGRIKFDAEKCEIVYELKTPIFTGEENKVRTNEFRYGKFNRAKQMASGVPLNKCNFATLPDKDQNKLLMAMTGISDDKILMALDIPDFSDLRMIGGYFFN